MTAAAMATTATVEAARITRHSFPGDPLMKTKSWPSLAPSTRAQRTRSTARPVPRAVPGHHPGTALVTSVTKAARAASAG
jgi:hypothetical protein